ncbi:uncharacterized protein LOC118188198 isoform X2 [Stegodyphus dumicola]|uniref:uncharacterized protein LOC118188198 isoform X2 n=1 Tax=Stegodyphus dumicola TaxID=202533 RepID=UPI0015B1E65B|nr:uncharacterized protein LOC118188198 isoform X2 [Stegodyphus dumicola]
MSNLSSNVSFLKRDTSDLLSLYKKYESFPNNLRYSKQSNISPSRSNVRDAIISLMKELNLNGKLQQELLYYADTGKSFPFLPKKIINFKERKIEKPLSAKLLKLPDKPMQRTKSTIEQIGAYEREQFRPNPSKTRASHEKERLQNLMAFGEDLNKEPNIITIDTEPSRISKEDLFDETTTGIRKVGQRQSTALCFHVWHMNIFKLSQVIHLLHLLYTHFRITVKPITKL